MKSIRIPNVDRGDPIEIVLNGKSVKAYEGETVATVLLAERLMAFENVESGYLPGRVFCNMGVCQQCLVTINGQPNCQACKTIVISGMEIETEYDI